MKRDARSNTTFTADNSRNRWWSTRNGNAAAKATPNHTTGGNSSHDSSANVATPVMLPSRLMV